MPHGPSPLRDRSTRHSAKRCWNSRNGSPDSSCHVNHALDQLRNGHPPHI
jgi:hypothetical protein